MESGVSAATPARAPQVGLLHTVPALAGVFQASVENALPGSRQVHLADPWLLSTAIETGITDEVGRRVAEHIGYLVDSGAEAVLVTCSSIGEAVEAAATSVDVPVLRVDAPMSTRAVEMAHAVGSAAGRPGRITVLATLAATLGPTGRLIQRAADAAAGDTEVDSIVVQGAVAARDAGDQAAHDRLIAEAVRTASGRADVIVLAQASMARAVAHAPQPVAVLTSPDSGVAALARALA